MSFVLAVFSTGPRYAPKKLNYDAPSRTISFFGLTSSHDLVETAVFVALTHNIGMFAVYDKGGCLRKRSSLNLVVLWFLWFPV